MSLFVSFSIHSRMLISSYFRRISGNFIQLKAHSVRRLGFDRGVVDTIPIAFIHFMIGQTESFLS